MRPFASIATFLAAAGTTYGSGAFPTASGSASPIQKMPACWGQCFGQFNVSGTPEMLCSPKISGFVNQCIAVSCEAAGEAEAATQYSSWLHEFCGGHNPFASGSGYIEPPIPSTSSAAASSSAPTSSSIPVEPTSSSIPVIPTSSAPISGQAPAPVFTGTGGHFPFPPSGTGTPGRPPMPSCWQSCFTKSNVTYPEALCFEHPGTEVSQCVQSTCESSGETNAYYQWVQSFCSPATTGAPAASTSSHSESLSSAVPTTSSASISSSIPTFSHSAPAFPGTGHPPVGTGSPIPSGLPPMPVCWDRCFSAFNISNPESLCYGNPGSAVSSCIQTGCAANETQGYFGWVQSFCLGSTGSASAAPSTSSSPAEPLIPSTSSEIATSSSLVPIISSIPVISGTAPYPHPTGAVPSHPAMPACWGRCFATYNVSSPEQLCSRHPGNMVHSCISASCAANETAQYNGWVQSACHVGTGTGVIPSTSSQVPFTSSEVPTSSSAPVESAPASSVVVHPTGGEPSFPSGGIPQPTGGVSYPACWGQCFAQSHVYSPAALCAPDVGSVVSACISQSCNANDTARYDGWQHSFCNHTMVPTGSAISHPVGSSTLVPSGSSPFSAVPTSSAVPPLGTGVMPPHGTGVVPPHGTGVVPPHGTGSPHQPSTNYTMPACWTSCFQAYHVDSPAQLCQHTKGGAVKACIKNMCTEPEAAQFGGWKDSFCNSTMPSGTGVSSSSYPVGPTPPPSSSMPVIVPTNSSVADIPSASSGLPVGTGSFPHPTGGAQPPSGNHTMPECWNSCFKQYNVSDPRALCAPSMGPLVNTCISSSCNATEAGKYTWWLHDFCQKPVPTGASSSFSFSLPAGTGSPSAIPSASISVSHSVPLGTAPVGTAPIGTAPVGNGSLPHFPTGTGVPSHPDMPACWSKCFSENHVSSPASLCHPPMGPIVDSCIASTCTNGTDAAGYNGWLKSYCNSTMPVPTGSAYPSTSSYAVSSSPSASLNASTPVGPVSSSMPSGTAPIGTGHPFPPTGTGVPSHPAMPSCWTACFSQNHVTSPSGLCHPPLGPLVDTCITSSCNSTAAAGYQGWLHTYCSNSTAPAPTGGSSSAPTPSGTAPIHTSSAPFASSSAPVSVSVGATGTVPSFPPSGTGVPHTPGGNLPSCWGACFAQNHVVAKSALCLQPTKDAVSGCIAQSCAANETVQYTAWLNGFCPASTSAAGTGSSSHIVAPFSTGASASSHSMSYSASLTIPTSSMAVPGNSSVPVPPTNGTQIPACWRTCFKEHNVLSEAALCDPELTAYVAACIEGSCEGGSSDKYAEWVGDYCDASSGPSHSSIPVVEPSATPSASAAASEPAIVSSSSAPVVVQPVPSTSSFTPESTEVSPTTTGHPHRPTHGRPGKPGKPHKPALPSWPHMSWPHTKPQTTELAPTTTEPAPTTTEAAPTTVYTAGPTAEPTPSSSSSTEVVSAHPKPGRPGRPGRPGKHHNSQPHATKPHTTEQAPTTVPVYEPTPSPSSPTEVVPRPTTTSSSATSHISLSTILVDPPQPTSTEEPTTVTVPSTPTTTTQHQTPTTMATAVKPTTTTAAPAGPPAGYQGGNSNNPWANGNAPWGNGNAPWGNGNAPWGNGPPPWAGKLTGPPPEALKSIVGNMRGWLAGAAGH